MQQKTRERGFLRRGADIRTRDLSSVPELLRGVAGVGVRWREVAWLLALRRSAPMGKPSRFIMGHDGPSSATVAATNDEGPLRARLGEILDRSATEPGPPQSSRPPTAGSDTGAAHFQVETASSS